MRFLLVALLCALSYAQTVFDVAYRPDLWEETGEPDGRAMHVWKHVIFQAKGAELRYLLAVGHPVSVDTQIVASWFNTQTRVRGEATYYRFHFDTGQVAIVYEQSWNNYIELKELITGYNPGGVPSPPPKKSCEYCVKGGNTWNGEECVSRCRDGESCYVGEEGCDIWRQEKEATEKCKQQKDCFGCAPLNDCVWILSSQTCALYNHFWIPDYVIDQRQCPTEEPTRFPTYILSRSPTTSRPTRRPTLPPTTRPPTPTTTRRGDTGDGFNHQRTTPKPRPRPRTTPRPRPPVRPPVRPQPTPPPFRVRTTRHPRPRPIPPHPRPRPTPKPHQVRTTSRPKPTPPPYRGPYNQVGRRCYDHAGSKKFSRYYKGHEQFEECKAKCSADPKCVGIGWRYMHRHTCGLHKDVDIQMTSEHGDCNMQDKCCLVKASGARGAGGMAPRWQGWGPGWG